MPISSQAVITHIQRIKGSFNRSDLISAISSVRDEKKTRNKKSRRTQEIPAKDIQRIDETLRILVERGFLTKTRKAYSITGNFTAEGQILIKQNGDGVAMCGTSGEIHIRKENTSGARNRDTVQIRVREYRRDELHGTVERIIKNERETFFARIERLTRTHVFLRLMDVTGESRVVAARDNSIFPPGKDDKSIAMHYIVKPGKGEFAGSQLCTVTGSFPAFDEEQDINRIVSRNSLPAPHGDYDELKDIESRIDPLEMKGRKDYRKEFTVTIDGETAKDFDDAISLSKEKNNYKLTVHIADVSAYIRKGSPLDLEALERGTSIYLGYHVIPMLPEKLSNDLCSLREGTDRLTLSVEMTFDKKGDMLYAEYHRGIIRVNHRLTYTGAAATLSKKRPYFLYRRLSAMRELSEILFKKRMEGGRLDLNIPDQEMIFDEHRIKDIKFAQRLDTHKLIEEFMLSANETVSRILRENGIPTLYRIHEEMEPEKLNSLNDFLKFLGLKAKKKNGNLSLQEILDSVAGKEFEQVVNMVVLRSMMQAYYGIEPVGHFGLGFVDYTHFTSPIRRYPDLVVHRCLKSLIDKSNPPYKAESLAVIGEKTSDAERVAQRAERDLVNLKTCRLMAGKEGMIAPAVISGVSKYGIYVTLVEKPIEGMIPLRALTDDYYLVQEDEHSIVGKRYSKRFTLGDRITVRLVRSDLENMRIDFDLAGKQK